MIAPLLEGRRVPPGAGGVNGAVAPPRGSGCCLHGILTSIIEADDWADNSNYISHLGFDVSGITDPLDLIPAWLGHDRIKHGVHDGKRACSDLATYPRIAARITNTDGPSSICHTLRSRDFLERRDPGRHYPDLDMPPENGTDPGA